MPEQEPQKPRLIGILTFLLVLQVPLVVFLGLNLITEHWTFLFSWPVFWADLTEAFTLVLQTPGHFDGGEVLFFHVIAFGILTAGAVLALFSALLFNRGGAFPWILGLLAQTATLLAGIGLYWLFQPSQSYWLMAIGVLMVLYLNYGDVRQWFLQSKTGDEGSPDA